MMSSSHTLVLKLFLLACSLCGSTGGDITLPIKYSNHGRDIFCNGTFIKNGIYSESKYWVDCLNVGTKSDESFIAAIWRVYTCVLAKYKDDGSTTISLLEFSQIITSSYPDEIKKSLNCLVKSLGETLGKEHKWLTSKIKLTDYSDVDMIRVQYYGIEKAFCENGTDLLVENTFTLKSWDKCSVQDELMYRGSNCCGNDTLPFGRHHPDSPSALFNATDCERTLKSALPKLLENKYKAELLENYEFTCYLVEKSFMTIDEIRKTKMDECQMRLIVNVTYPYIPTQMQETLAENMVSMYNETDTTLRMNSLVKFLNLTNLMAEDEKSFMHSCEAINDIQARIPLYKLACPEPADQMVP